jgi:uncharacterized membrane protein YcgQ (UPF0703/DUF1980 family)
MTINFGIRTYYFKILDRLANDEDVSINQAKLPLYFMFVVMISFTLAFFVGIAMLVQVFISVSQHSPEVSILSMIQLGVLVIFGVLNIFLVMGPLMHKITTLKERN